MKQNILKTVTALSVLLSAPSAFAGNGALEGKVYTQAEVDAQTADEVAAWANAGARFQAGVYLKGAYIYIGGDSVYAGNTAGNQSSLVVTEEKITRASIAAVTDIVSARIDSRTGRNGGSSSTSLLDTNGANGGSSEAAFGIWSRFDYTHLDDSTKGAKWDANLLTFALGGDYKFTERFLAGVALTYGHVSGKTKFNNGKIKGDHSYGVTPYMNLVATDWLDFDGLAGYMHTKKKRDRTPKGGTKVTAKTDSNRYFFAFAGNAHKTYNKIAVLGRLGYTYGQDNQKKYKESNGGVYGSQDTKVSRLFARLQTGFLVSEMFTPYVFLTYDHDFSITKHGLDDGVNNAITGYTKPKQNTSNWYGAGAGVTLASGRNWTGGLEYGFKATKDMKMHNGNIRLRYAF